MSYNRINLDGKSRTEAGILAADYAPGTVVQYVVGNDNYIASDGTLAQQYVVNESAESVNLSDVVTTGETANLEIVTPGRLLACVLATGQTIVKDSPLKVTATGLALGIVGTDVIFAVATEAVTTTASTDYLSVRTK